VSTRSLVLWLACVSAVAGAQVRKDVPELGLSVPVPKGWQGTLEQDPGEPQSFAVQPVGADGVAGVALVRQPAPALPEGTTLGQAFAQLALELTAGAPVKPAGPPEFFKVEGREAGRQYFRGEQDGEPLELHVALWPDGESWVAAVGAWKVAEAARMRGAVDGVMKGLKTLKAAPAPERSGLAGALAGCWNEVYRSTGGAGSGYREATYTFSADGRFSHRSMATVGAGGMSTTSQDSDEGRWTVSGETVQLQSEGGETVKLPASVKGGLLVLGGRRYVPCGR
jgi:hypothetical protein